jgi:competence protein CoiA
MLTSIRQRDNYKVHALEVDKFDAPFMCPKCGCETILRQGSVKVHHFAHKPPVFCEYGQGESEAHRVCKQSIYDELRITENVTLCELEKDFGSVVADVFFIFIGVKIAIEVQISNLTMSRIIERTQEYNKLGVYVLWLSLFDSKLEEEVYAPKQWEKWLHATYFGRVYYWIEGLSIIPIHFDEHLLWVEATDYGGGYYRKSKRYRTPREGCIVNLVSDFKFKEQKGGKFHDIYVPRCKILIDNTDVWWK